MAFKLNFKLNLNPDAITPTAKKALLVLPPVAIIAILGFLFIWPDFQEMNKLNDEIAKQRKEIEQIQQKLLILPKLVAQYEKQRERLKELQVQLPDEKEVSALLRQVSQLGITSGLQVMLWKPKEKTVHPSKEIFEIPVDVEMRGHYHNIGLFYGLITGLPRIVNLANITLKLADKKVTKDAGSQLNVSFNALTYSMMSESEKSLLDKKEPEKKP